MKLLALSAAAALVASAASAGPVTVRTGGLDLTDPTDATVMVRRIDVAAAEACGADRGSVRDVQVAIRRTDCYAAAMERTVRALNAPAVDSAYRARGAAAR